LTLGRSCVLLLGVNVTTNGGKRSTAGWALTETQVRRFHRIKCNVARFLYVFRLLTVGGAEIIVIRVVTSCRIISLFRRFGYRSHRAGSLQRFWPIETTCLEEDVECMHL
jgi:hypothetical protein